MTHAVIVNVGETCIFTGTCEVLDTPDDPDNKVFRFEKWDTRPEGWPSHQSGLRADGSGPDGRVRIINVYSAPEWIHDSETWDPRPKLGSYRITTKLDTPDGYVAAYEGTTKPLPKPVDVPAVNDTQERDAGRMLKIEDTIMLVLERENRITLRSLKRKTHAERCGADWDMCLQSLADGGELQIEQDPQVPQRTWIALSPASVISDTNQSGDNLTQ